MKDLSRTVIDILTDLSNYCTIEVEEDLEPVPGRFGQVAQHTSIIEVHEVFLDRDFNVVVRFSISETPDMNPNEGLELEVWKKLGGFDLTSEYIIHPEVPGEPVCFVYQVKTTLQELLQFNNNVILN